MTKEEIEYEAFDYATHHEDDIFHKYELFKAYKEGIRTFTNNLKHAMCEKPPMGELILIEINMDYYRKMHEGINISPAFCKEIDYHDDWNFYSNNPEYKCWISVNTLSDLNK